MKPLSKINKRGRKRMRPRVEELIKIDIQALIMNKPGSRYSVIDDAGNKIRFVGEMSGNEMTLAVFLNNVRQGSYPLVEREIPGRISSPVDADKMYFYYVVIDGRRHKHLYVDPVRNLIGSRTSLRALYTSQSVGPKQVPVWRNLQKARKAKVLMWRRRST